ncbi:hypothetical protein EXIGLDRAFT_725147, partial [Exidia glandulosa HHB12029]
FGCSRLCTTCGRSIGTRVSEGGWAWDTALVRTPHRTAQCFSAQHFLCLRRLSPSPFLVPESALRRV